MMDIITQLKNCRKCGQPPSSIKMDFGKAFVFVCMFCDEDWGEEYKSWKDAGDAWNERQIKEAYNG